MTESNQTTGSLPTEERSDSNGEAVSSPTSEMTSSGDRKREHGLVSNDDRDVDDDTVGPLPSEMILNDNDDNRDRGGENDDTVGPLPSKMEDSSSTAEPPKKKPKRRGMDFVEF